MRAEPVSLCSEDSTQLILDRACLCVRSSCYTACSRRPRCWGFLVTLVKAVPPSIPSSFLTLWVKGTWSHLLFLLVSRLFLQRWNVGSLKNRNLVFIYNCVLGPYTGAWNIPLPPDMGPYRQMQPCMRHRCAPSPGESVHRVWVPCDIIDSEVFCLTPGDILIQLLE